MKLLRTLIFLFMMFIVLAVIVGLILPRKIHVEQTKIINAPATTVFNQVNNLENWENWSYWKLNDPEMAITYPGQKVGKGATYTWKSKGSGNGSMEIIESNPNSSLKTELKFDQGGGFGTWKFEPEGNGTKVTWAFDTDMGSNPLMSIKGLIMKRILNTSLKESLENIKGVVEVK